MKHLELYQQLKQSNPHIDNRWLPELERLVGVCQQSYNGNWQVMYLDYVNSASSKKTTHTPQRMSEIRRDVGLLSTINSTLEESLKELPPGCFPREHYTATVEVIKEAASNGLTLEQYAKALPGSRPEKGLASANYNAFVKAVNDALDFERIFKSQLTVKDDKLYVKIQ